MAAPSVLPSVIRSLVLLALVACLLYFIAQWVLWLFGGGGNTQRSAVMLAVEDRGTVNVSLEGGLMQRAEESLKLYAGDRVATGGNGNAMLTFFDGSAMRIDVQSDIAIEQSARGEETSELELVLTKGALWVRTPDISTFSGAVTRIIDTPRYALTIPSDTEAVIEEDMLLVFSADGAGIAMLIDGQEEPIYIGEGQQIELPEGDIAGDPLQYRSAIEPLAVQRDFIEESRGITVASTPSTGTGTTAEDAMLTVGAPADRTTVTTATIRIEGTVAKRVERVRVNGNDATINRADGSFSQELSLREGQDTTITIDALDARGIVLAKVTRTVRRGAEGIATPVINSPAKAGETYRTSKTEFAISGTVPAGTAGVMVNEYKLQLFRTGSTTWSYLASTALNNLKAGTNVYDVYALDAQGQKSTPARITILLEAGSEGIVTGASSAAAGGSTSSVAVIDETTLPKNDPLQPGTLSVTGPTAGAAHTATGSEFLLAGLTPSTTATVWVNGYRLQLYKPGNTYWNYIAKTDFGTLKPGTNTYVVTARNEKNEILDTFTYTVTYNP